ncbi:GvpL/GvpF family gas vesicle protein [Methylococcus sp. Mc7]|uniref:GvpL/GvpF family gas vesicle protein n=1 Tax=Methylococcus sp. Mc7 TaxID=2860258 RepID=UPI002106C7A3|nr:GvpL/GvpF family gas vesicle protein [Methylococcus sp. Mc7]
MSSPACLPPSRRTSTACYLTIASCPGRNEPPPNRSPLRPQDRAPPNAYFGTVAESRKAVSKMLKTYQSRLVKQLRELGGKVEMGLRVALDAPDVYEYLIAQSPEILALRDQMALRGGGAHSEKIELGRQFAELLEDTRSASFEKIEAALAPFCFEIHSNTVKGDKEIANLAFLVDREKLPEFERGVEKIADEFDDRFTFQYSGPWAPYNFVNMELDL